MAESVSFDRVAEVYDETRGGMARGRRIAKDVAEFLQPGPTLEVGVGTGAVALGLRELGHPVVGVDLSPGMLASAYRRLGPCVAVADALALPVATGALGNAVFVHVLHLVGDMAAAIAEAARALRPGGRLIAVHAAPRMEPDDLTEATAPTLPLRQRRVDTPEALRVAGAAVGLRPAAERWSSPAVIHESPAALAEKYEQRVFSWMWRIDDAAWERTVAPVIAALLALPEPHRPRRHVGRTRVSVLQRVG